ncbi:HDOD domain-containing protein [Roseateles koreensis]|uniref:HDOD domain-containing protein n=1 Tax=Roseateles koreensis TaxID=2987526 RepID=A0ABT5KNR3_9BURK|nr:HDOD domain-containing protein [Roseateles koreensis]MDC8784559.1 HDOD domain-containing protein [Roseateles koreensis]
MPRSPVTQPLSSSQPTGTSGALDASWPNLRQPLPDLASWAHFCSQAHLPILLDTAEYLNLMREHEDAADANNLGEQIARDPLMSLRLLAHASEQRSSRLPSDTQTVIAALVLMGITPFFSTFAAPLTVESHLAAQPLALQGLRQAVQRADRTARLAHSFAIHRNDPSAPAVHCAALLHDFADLLLWSLAPELALQVQAHQHAHPLTPRADVQRNVLNIELSALEKALIQHWRLPPLLHQLRHDEHGRNPQAQCVLWAVNWVHHTANDEARDEGEKGIAAFLDLSLPATRQLLHEFDETTAETR